MLCLVYVSAATDLFSDDDLVGLLRQSRADNEKAGLTGMLLYSAGNFMQALEGDDDRVLALQAKIAMDSRHRRVTTVLKLPIAERRFWDWSMAFTTLDQIPEADRPGYRRFMGISLERRDTPERNVVLKLLDGFRATMRP